MSAGERGCLEVGSLFVRCQRSLAGAVLCGQCICFSLFLVHVPPFFIFFSLSISLSVPITFFFFSLFLCHGLPVVLVSLSLCLALPLCFILIHFVFLYHPVSVLVPAHLDVYISIIKLYVF